MKVRCNNCMEVFDEKELVYDGDEDMEFCPYCGGGGCIMDLPKDEFPEEYKIVFDKKGN